MKKDKHVIGDSLYKLLLSCKSFANGFLDGSNMFYEIRAKKEELNKLKPLAMHIRTINFSTFKKMIKEIEQIEAKRQKRYAKARAKFEARHNVQ